MFSNDWTVTKIFQLPLKDGNITPEKVRELRQMQLRDKTAYAGGLCYRWDPSLSKKPRMPPCNTQHHDSRCYICRWILSYVTFCLSQTLWDSPQVKSWWESHILLFPMLRYISGGLKPDKQLSNYITITLQITITENFKEFNTGKKSNKMLVHVLLMTNTCSNLSSSYWCYWW